MKAQAQLAIDFLKVSRPGWWVVTAWLYVAPAQTLGYPFWVGLIYVCVPLNVVTYGLNDYADVELDATNNRKGNWVYGPKNTSRQRLRQVLRIAFVMTLLPIVIWGWWQARLLQYLVWYMLGIVINVAYNFEVLGHWSGHGPWEIPLVYAGFSLVTVLSYWINGHSGGYRSGQLLFGCNARYWTHLGFLVVRTQLWTELMDYNLDRTRKRKTTLAKLSSRSLARSTVLGVLLVEVAWNWRQYQQVPEWKNLLVFSVLGAISFVGMEYAGKPRPVSLITLAIVQSLGAVWLIQDTWNKRLFVS